MASCPRHGMPMDSNTKGKYVFQGVLIFLYLLTLIIIAIWG